ncbi:hypothetical protein EDD21DRAFT_200688 [Dissophora ornata]|nr:hypothetical protein EDD21DRAFT_200688 [Dissophora ornata]
MSMTAPLVSLLLSISPPSFRVTNNLRIFLRSCTRLSKDNRHRPSRAPGTGTELGTDASENTKVKTAKTRRVRRHIISCLYSSQIQHRFPGPFFFFFPSPVQSQLWKTICSTSFNQQVFYGNSTLNSDGRTEQEDGAAGQSMVGGFFLCCAPATTTCFHPSHVQPSPSNARLVDHLDSPCIHP